MLINSSGKIDVIMQGPSELSQTLVRKVNLTCLHERAYHSTNGLFAKSAWYAKQKNKVKEYR